MLWANASGTPFSSQTQWASSLDSAPHSYRQAALTLSLDLPFSPLKLDRGASMAFTSHRTGTELSLSRALPQSRIVRAPIFLSHALSPSLSKPTIRPWRDPPLPEIAPSRDPHQKEKPSRRTAPAEREPPLQDPPPSRGRGPLSERSPPQRAPLELMPPLHRISSSAAAHSLVALLFSAAPHLAKPASSGHRR